MVLIGRTITFVRLNEFVSLKRIHVHVLLTELILESFSSHNRTRPLTSERVYEADLELGDDLAQHRHVVSADAPQVRSRDDQSL